MGQSEQLQGRRMLKAQGRVVGLGGGTAEPARSGGGAGDERADLPTLGQALRGGGRGGALSPPAGVGRAVPEEAAKEVERLYRERYAGFTANGASAAEVSYLWSSLVQTHVSLSEKPLYSSAIFIKHGAPFPYKTGHPIRGFRKPAKGGDHQGRLGPRMRTSASSTWTRSMSNFR
jgi:hypothetical protein